MQLRFVGDVCTRDSNADALANVDGVDDDMSRVECVEREMRRRRGRERFEFVLFGTFVRVLRGRGDGGDGGENERRREHSGASSRDEREWKRESV